MRLMSIGAVSKMNFLLLITLIASLQAISTGQTDNPCMMKYGEALSSSSQSAQLNFSLPLIEMISEPSDMYLVEGSSITFTCCFIREIDVFGTGWGSPMFKATGDLESPLFNYNNTKGERRDYNNVFVLRSEVATVNLSADENNVSVHCQVQPSRPDIADTQISESRLLIVVGECRTQLYYSSYIISSINYFL